MAAAAGTYGSIAITKAVEGSAKIMAARLSGRVPAAAVKKVPNTLKAVLAARPVTS